MTREGEGETRVPPRRHLRKLEARIDRLREKEPGCFDAWRLKSGGPNRAWVGEYDDVAEAVTVLLDDLLGREPGGDDR